MKNPLRMLATLVLTMTMAACSQAYQDQTDAKDAASEASTPQSAKRPSGPAYAIPDRLSNCAQGSVVELNWDFRTVQPSASEIEVMTGTPPNETLFAVGGPSDKAATGAWARPGTSFTFKDKASGQELAKVIVEGPDCSQG